MLCISFADGLKSSIQTKHQIFALAKYINYSYRNLDTMFNFCPIIQEFLTVMEKVFKWSCLIGVLGSKRHICYLWSAFILGVLLFMESQAIWKVIKALAGWAIDTAGQSE